MVDQKNLGLYIRGVSKNMVLSIHSSSPYSNNQQLNIFGNDMARIRTIKPDFWTSEQIVECSRDARLLFIGMWNFCDDRGIHPASTKRLKMEVFPAEDDMNSDSIQLLIDELLQNNLIKEYQIDSNQYWIVTGWKHQKIDKPTYKHPPPQNITSRELVEPSPPERKGKEGKGRDSTGQKRFQKPSLEDIRGYCQERKNNVNPLKFFNHYESNGWKVGKNPMKSWKAAIRTWEQNSFETTPKQPDQFEGML